MLSRTVLVVAISLWLWSLVPAALGMTTTTVMSGSMTPAIAVGDEVVTRPFTFEKLQVGQVVLVDDPDQAGRLRLHRIAAIRGDELTLRGDANAAADSSPVRRSAVHGVAFLRVPFAGLPMYWVRTGQWGIVAAFVAASGVLVLTAGSRRLLEPGRRRRAHAPVPRQRGADRPARHAQARSSTAAQHLIPAIASAGTSMALIAGLVGGVGAAPSAAAHSNFSALATTATSSFATGSFPCLVRSAPAGLAAQPSVYYSFAEPTGTSTANLAGSGNAGVSTGAVSHVDGSCDANASPAVQVGGAARGTVTVPTSLTSPSVFTVAVWFKSSTGGGLIAGFGSAGDGSASGTFDRQLTMNTNGSLAFRVAGTLGPATITTPGTYKDNVWHLAVFSLSVTAMSLSVDGALAAGSLLGGLTLTTYTGYWRFGYDAIPGSTTTYFSGQLDEIQIWNTLALGTADITTLLNAGH